jgi:protocatechuate 3,4-dioxygenase alpha subunit
MPGQTPSQTVGPYFAYGLTGARYNMAQPIGAALFPGAAIRITGQVTDGDGAPIPDAMIEAWQPGEDGRFGMALDGFGRSETDADGRYAFTTVKPGAIAPGHAPHIGLIVFMRGLLTHLFTRLYFPEDSALHAADPVLSRVPAERRGALVAAAIPGGYSLDIRMQGAGETVFLEF